MLWQAQKARNALPEGLGSVHPGAEVGSDRAERKASIQPDDRVRPEVPARGLQLGREVERRGGEAPAGIKPPAGPEVAQGEESQTG